MRRRKRKLPKPKGGARRRFGTANIRSHTRDPRGPNNNKPRVSVRKYRRGVAR